ncbi:hypothetical protein BU15DRAFT_80887 [Melanogaster broomeanus]|nr:hypothetical protein BU15DRAFT_80887 [Melanogaster broomeanus]
MPSYNISKDLNARIPALHHDSYSVQQICDLLAIKKTLVYKTLSLFSNYGLVSNPYRYSRVGRHPRLLSQSNLVFIQTVIDHSHTIYLDELQQELFAKQGVHASLSTLARAVKQLHITRKVVTAPALERNKELHALYMNRIGAEVPDPNSLVFIDESAKDERTSFQKPDADKIICGMVSFFHALMDPSSCPLLAEVLTMVAVLSIIPFVEAAREKWSFLLRTPAAVGVLFQFATLGVIMPLYPLLLVITGTASRRPSPSTTIRSHPVVSQ